MGNYDKLDRVITSRFEHLGKMIDGQYDREVALEIVMQTIRAYENEMKGTIYGFMLCDAITFDEGVELENKVVSLLLLIGFMVGKTSE